MNHGNNTAKIWQQILAVWHFLAIEYLKVEVSATLQAAQSLYLRLQTALL